MILHPNPGNIKRLRELRGLSIEDLAKAVKLSASTITRYEGVAESIPSDHLRRLSRALYVPMSLFFADELPVDVQIPDFRTTDNRPAVVSAPLARKIAQSSEVLSVATDIHREFFGEIPDLPSIHMDLTSPDQAANIIRQRFGLDALAYKTVDNSDQLFSYYRSAIEANQILVLLDNVSSDGVRGFCLASADRLNLIMVNREGLNRQAQTWTLIHELIHVCLGRTGVSDPASLRNRTEKYCNKVTAEILLPRDQFVAEAGKYDSDSGIEALVGRLYREFKVSYYAICIRLKELKLRPEASFEKFIALIRSQGFSAAPDDAGDKNIIGGGNYKYLALANLGAFSIELLSTGVDQNFISPVDFFRFTAVKPKWLPELREIVRARVAGAR